ncbi:PDF receptor-like isoform X2 [Phymastichus coffea]|uniref:PDF receptor-like isoform X2 n=1 Tax=Phymastichus coffea TaxID=108790 RepID=UPI00273BB5F8|nr:PDF receptor-like isoform X2 [Phymastichus coffea]
MDFPAASGNDTQVLCELQHRDYIVPENEVWCSWAWDSILCWPPTRASTVTKLRCPLANGIDTRKFVEKRCGDDGRWEGRDGTTGDRDSPSGWTNYTPCFTPEMLLLIRKLYTGSEDLAKVKLDIAAKTRHLEFVGLSISLTALLLSLSIFCRFRSLRNTRTRIHKNLFVAMVIQVVIRLTLYIDQAVFKSKVPGVQRGIQNTPVLCEASYVLLEYARTAMFMWMFIEGLYLHNLVTVTQMHETTHYKMYRIVGWGYPMIMTMTWAIVTALNYHPSKCWWGYNLSLYFWILEGPRMGVILFNFLFLLNIIRVLVVKLRQTRTSEIQQVRLTHGNSKSLTQLFIYVWKAVRAALVLLPLLGITNLVSMTEAPLEKSVWEFAMWSYCTHFLTSFQGLFIATLYCFLNGEVKLALDKTISVYMSVRGTDVTRRQSMISGCQTQRMASVIEVEETEVRPGAGWIRLCCRGGNIPPPDRPAETSL